MKKLIALLMALTVCFAFAACGGSNEPAPAGSGEISAEDDNTGASIPVLRGGDLPFTDMEVVATENYSDGSYYYEDMTSDGMISVINTAFANINEEGQSPEEYAAAAAASLAGDAEVTDIECVQSEECTEMLSYPVYLVQFTAGANEDTRIWTVYMTCTDTYTYLYAFNVWADYGENLDDVFVSVFASLTLEDPQL